MSFARSAVPLLALLAPFPALAAPRATVEIQLISVSDWHGQLDAMSGVGGAAALATYFERERASNPDTLVLAAGDSFGASPPLSSFFDEEPSVLAMNLMGFDADTLGNHNFDSGLTHLQSMVDLAEFPFVAANLDNIEDNLSGVDTYALFDFSGVTVAVIGLTNADADHLVFPGSFGTITIADPVTRANQARARAQADGAKVIVGIVHMGVEGYDADGNATGPLIDFANEVGNFDVILGDHTDVQYSGVHNGALVVQNRSKGLTYARTTLEVDPGNGRVESTSTTFLTPTASAVAADPEVTALLAPYRAQLTALLDAPIGQATALFPRGSNAERLREAAIGNLVTDAMRYTYATDIALTNGGGLRASLPSSYAPADRTLRRPATGYATGTPYDLVAGDAYTVLPFGNEVVVRDLTGTELWDALEISVQALPSANGRFLQVSGFSFEYNVSRPVGDRIRSVTLDDGTPILPDATVYSCALPDFVNEGGDGYSVFLEGDHGTSFNLMADDLMGYIELQGTITPVVEGRITAVSW